MLVSGLGLLAVSLAYEDGKFTREEIVGILNQLFVGLGMEIDFAGMCGDSLDHRRRPS